MKFRHIKMSKGCFRNSVLTLTAENLYECAGNLLCQIQRSKSAVGSIESIVSRSPKMHGCKVCAVQAEPPMAFGYPNRGEWTILQFPRGAGEAVQGGHRAG